MSKLIIIGAGGHGRVIADATHSKVVFLDDSLVGEEIVGTLEDIDSVQQLGDEIIVAIGNNNKRMEVLKGLSNVSTVIHPSSVVSEKASICCGTVIFANAVVNTGAIIGSGCIINTSATVDHDCILGDGVHVSPGAHLGGGVTVGSNSWVGLGASVKHGITIGNNVVVGAGAVVVSNIPDGKTFVGNPAKELLL